MTKSELKKVFGSLSDEDKRRAINYIEYLIWRDKNKKALELIKYLSDSDLKEELKRREEI